jgi:uncharacterized membrane protein (DUF106 family)
MAILDTIFWPFLALPPVLSIMLLGALISIAMVLIYKWMTDQKLMKRLKTQIKDDQKKMRELKDNPKKLMDIQKKAMEANMQYMMQSFKPTLITFIPIIIIFAWLNTHMGYVPLVQDQQFTVTAAFEDGTTGTIEMINVPDQITLLNGEIQTIQNGKAEWSLTGKSGDYSLSYQYQNKTGEHKLVITNGEKRYAKPVILKKELGLDKTQLKSITISNVKIKPFMAVPIINQIPWIKDWGWLGTYILFSLGFSILFRKLFSVY